MSVSDLVSSLICEQEKLSAANPKLVLNTKKLIEEQMKKKPIKKIPTITVVVYPTEEDKIKNQESYLIGQKNLSESNYNPQNY